MRDDSNDDPKSADVRLFADPPVMIRDGSFVLKSDKKLVETTKDGAYYYTISNENVKRVVVYRITKDNKLKTIFDNNFPDRKKVVVGIHWQEDENGENVPASLQMLDDSDDSKSAM